MFLKSLEMFGFKSFADKVRIVFEPGITVIVGPNGCGKSNTMDGVRWVLGEKQARSIRGEKMEDVIFSGTEQRKPVSLAEISITLDNSSRLLDIASDSVTVSRRVFRDGESEYYINKSQVRLKEIETLFLDTGIGKSAYSVMEQGKIDLILSNKPEDRRFLFEEAAGISRFKFQKKESLKKLNDTESNLERINDIIKEIERERDLKAKQAEKLNTYLSLKEGIKDNDIKLHIHKYILLSKKKIKLQSGIERLRQERESISAKVSLISAENERDEKLKNDIQLQLFELDKELHTYRIKVEDIINKTEKNYRLIKEQHNRRDSIKKKTDERIKNLYRLREERGETENAGRELANRLKTDNCKLDELLGIQKLKLDSIQKSRNNIEENKGRIESEELGLKGLRDNLEEVIKRLIDAIEKRKAELMLSEVKRQEVRGRINDRLNNIDSKIQDALINLPAGRVEVALEDLSHIDIESLKVDILKFERYEDGFRSILFDKTGIHAKKEDLDRNIRDKMSLIDNLRSEIDALELYIQREQNELENVNRGISRLEKELSINENEKNWIEKHLKSLDMQIIDIEKQIENFMDDISQSENIAEKLAGEIKEWESLLFEFNKKSESLKKNMHENTAKREEINIVTQKRADAYRRDIEYQKQVVEKISEREKNLIEIDFRIKSIEEYLWTEYEKKTSDLPEPSDIEKTDYDHFQATIQELKKRVQELGPINNLAVEEYNNLKERFNYYQGQKEDIEKARDGILSVIRDLVDTSVQMIEQTFEEIRKNFTIVFKQLFEGGDATIELTDRSNILESGIDIMARPPGKRLKNINLLSGGERALTAIALLFATYMVRPSPFYFLDEIDAPLDEENIGRFIKLLKKFAKRTQFIIITHNKKTISIGESIYGVTMEEPGVSRIISMKMDKIAKDAV
ncbi:MAG: AAA family ATPase [Spirochaetota bacterium]|nr:AAA family ATPase [Spirochaetota bacterium]